MRLGLGAKQVPILDVDQPAVAAAGRDEKYSIAVLEAKYASLAPQQVPPALPPPVDGEVRQLPRGEQPGGPPGRRPPGGQVRVVLHAGLRRGA